VSVPLITILIFFYQSFGEAYFVLVVVAMEIWSIASAFKGFMTALQNNLVTLLSSLLAMAGFLCWVFFDESALIIANYLVEQGNQVLWEQTFLTIFTTLTSIVFSYFFSKVITVQIVSRLSAMTFAHGVSGKVVYEEEERDGTITRTKSSLWVLDIWREGSRSRSNSVSRTIFRSMDSVNLTNPLDGIELKTLKNTAVKPTERKGATINTERVQKLSNLMHDGVASI
jgi:hypothetical protein